jgi:dTMP kinase
VQNEGLWLVVEGIDGAGKTSAIQTIEAFFKSQGLEYISLREPGGTPLGESIRTIFKSSAFKIEGLSQVLLMYAARVQLLQTVILPSLSKGCSVILDRHELSTYAYQAGADGVDMQTIEKISKVVMPSRKPNLTLYLAVRPEVSQYRIQQRGERDHFDQNSQDYFARILNNYETCIHDYPNVMRIDANQDFVDVQADIQIELQKWFARSSR